jgi:hypothetical protein
MIFPRLDDRAEKGSSNEGPGIGKKDLRQVQGDYPRRRGTRHLREPEAQAASGISQAWQGKGDFQDRFQVSGFRDQSKTAVAAELN